MVQFAKNSHDEQIRCLAERLVLRPNGKSFECKIHALCAFSSWRSCDCYMQTCLRHCLRCAWIRKACASLHDAGHPRQKVMLTRLDPDSWPIGESSRARSAGEGSSIYIYIYICIYMCVYIYIYIYIYNYGLTPLPPTPLHQYSVNNGNHDGWVVFGWLARWGLLAGEW